MPEYAFPWPHPDWWNVPAAKLSEAGEGRDMLTLTWTNGDNTFDCQAYWQVPQGVGPFPAILLLHGGGGQAFPDWGQEWVDRGWAALTMDLRGKSLHGNPLPNGIPPDSEAHKFRIGDHHGYADWPYMATGMAMMAHSWMLSHPEVDADRTAWMGVSWGGYLGLLVSGFDQRFRVGASAYGAGGLMESSMWSSGFSKMNEAARSAWNAHYEPITRLASTQFPLLIRSGARDLAFHFKGLRDTALKIPQSHLAIVPDWKHGHVPARQDRTITQFIERLGAWPEIGLPRISPRQILLPYTGQLAGARAFLHYCSSDQPGPEADWHSVSVRIWDGHLISPTLPAVAKYGFWTVEESSGWISSRLATIPIS
ncbi:prolyl oligopeptidase family serine peptidase [Pontibacter sp. G13]|uniref:alpha/beta hydrolase family protein n=1 Tax=Pontibacter sp. G13 TaxID=3074898 RepID=UPI00288A0230|nr:prolyl oligopeptidase family serine peptidase [Pontibacter sp. G13]WNJ19837.1 prolyl oligopeptidase family serine peptidase [Pontibacter sp. G13]